MGGNVPALWRLLGLRDYPASFFFFRVIEAFLASGPSVDSSAVVGLTCLRCVRLVEILRSDRLSCRCRAVLSGSQIGVSPVG